MTDPSILSIGQSTSSSHSYYIRTKRIVDVLGAIALLLFLSPVLIVIVLCLAACGGPIFFVHERVGHGGTSFNCLKFRTMHINAEQVLNDLLMRDPVARLEWESTRKLRDDPRITRIGHLLRALSLDELPQLINIIRGDMSLVGPRPVVAAELESFYKPLGGVGAYLSVRPGLTGQWQICGRSDRSYEERVGLDVAYVSDMSLTTDAFIILKTLRVVLSRKGAR
jgi:exopolysaccharide production protein ExoY